jgi:guanylate kinase
MIVVISGTSGAGKTTLVYTLIANTTLPMRRAITCTTRPPRKGERHGVDYYFLNEKEFKLEDKAETAIVYGYHYGTPVEQLATPLNEVVILVIDVEGFRQIRSKHETLSFFIITSEYKERLIKRGTEGNKDIESRLKTAEIELKSISEYDYVIVNDEISEAVAQIEGTINSHYQSITLKDKGLAT